MHTTEVTRRIPCVKAALAGLGIAVCSLSAAPGADQGSTSVQTREFPGHTAPSEKRDQNFDLPGVVYKVYVKEGDAVVAGETPTLVAQQDTRADEAALEKAKITAESDLEVDAEAAQKEKDEVDLNRKEELIKQKAISPSEYEEAKLAVKIDTLKLENAKKEKLKASYEVAEGKAKIEMKKMYARIDGVISQISTHEGELTNSDTQHPTMTIVKNDPLYVEVDLPIEAVKQLKLNDTLNVQYVDEKGTNTWRLAQVHFIKPEADPGSNYDHVQLQMPNTDHRSSGLQVTVRLPDRIAVTGAGAVDTASAK